MDRLTQTAKRQGIVFGRLQQHVAVLVVAQFAETITRTSGQPAMLVKGGSSLELRRGISASRTSKDLDAVTHHDLNELHTKLRLAAATGWEGFTGTVTPIERIKVPGLAQPPARFVVKLAYHGRSFATVPVEVSSTEVGNTQRFDEIPVEGLDQLELAPTVEDAAAAVTAFVTRIDNSA